MPKNKGFATVIYYSNFNGGFMNKSYIFSVVLFTMCSFAMEQENKNKLHQLMQSIKDHNYRDFYTIIKQDINVDQVDEDGNRPLDILIENYQSYDLPEDVMFTFFLKKAKELNYRAKNGNTPLINAVLYQKGCAIDFLLKAGAQVEGRSKSGATALMLLAKRRERLNGCDQYFLDEIITLLEQERDKQQQQRRAMLEKLSQDATSFMSRLPKDLIYTIVNR